MARTVVGTFAGPDSQCNSGIYRQQKTFPVQKTVVTILGYYHVCKRWHDSNIPAVQNLGMTNSFWVYVIPGMFSAFNMLVIRTYMNGLPESLEESAQLDGAGYTTIFWKITSPLCKPVYATVALFVAVGQWNSWFDAMLYNRMSVHLTTLQYELMKLLSSVTNQGNSAEAMKNAAGAVTPTSVRAAATVLTMLPIVCLYPFLQRYFVAGLTIGGVKE